MKALVVCEYSQVVTNALRVKGVDAYSNDILPTEGDSSYHIQCDVRELLRSDFIKTIDLLIAHDPCTVQCNSGVRWLINKNGIINQERYAELVKSCELTREILNAPVNKICRENPIPHKYALELIGVKYSQIIQPHYFNGSVESKATCLWLKNLPPLLYSHQVDKSLIKQSVWKMPPGENRGLERSRFPIAIANAMANQWG